MALREEIDSFFSNWSLAQRLRDRISRANSQGVAQPLVEMRALETERLVLRAFHQDDLKDLVNWQRDSGAAYTQSEIQDFLNFCFQEYSKRGIGPWEMLLRKPGIMVGSCSFWHINSRHKPGEVNYYITPQYRRQGLAVEALRAVMEFGFGDAGLARIQAQCSPDNASSERVMQKAGMRFERMTSSGEPSEDGSRHHKLYAVLRGDFQPRASADQK